VSQLSFDVSEELVLVQPREYDWQFTFSGGISVTAESLWRLLIDGRIRYTSTDHQQAFGLPKAIDLVEEVSEAIGDQRLSRIAVNERGDLLLSFADRTAIEVLVSSGGYESYNLAIGDRVFVATGGGNLVEVQR
jgi:hypothetical protein